MFLGSLLQLLRAVLQRTLGEQVDDSAATLLDPVDGAVSVDKAQHLDAPEHTVVGGIAAYHRHGILLTVRHAGRSHLDAVYIDIFQQLAGDDEFLMGQKRHAARLFAIAQGRVHDFYGRPAGHARFVIFTHSRAFPFFACIRHLLAASQLSTLSRFCTRKSTSSSPFMRQCFL